MIHEDIGVGIVAERFGHFAAIIASESAGRNDVLEAVLAEERSVDDMKIVKPGADLADIFNNKVGGIVGFEFFLVFEGVVELGEGHGARFKPTVEDFFNASEVFAVAVEFNLVDPGTVVVFEADAGKFFEFGVGADNFDGAFVASPNWHSSSPKTIA